MSTEKRGGKRAGKKTKSARKKTSLPSFGFGDDLLKSGGEGGAAPEAAADPGRSPSSEPAAAAEKITLPAFGFADDVLASRGQRVAREAPEPNPASPVAASSAEPAAGAETPPRAESSQATPAAGEERIFEFADDLEASYEEEPAAPVELETWVTFDLAGEIFALPVDPVHEIVRPSSITRVPHAPYPIRGVTNLRGRVVPVIDLRLRLELPESELTRTSRIVVVGSRGRRLGLLVDGVHQVVHLDVEQVQTPPDDVMTLQSDYISGVYHLGDELILLLDVDRVLIVKEAPPAPREAPPDAAERGAA